MSISQIRSSYQVPAKIGGRVLYTGGPEPREGKITSTWGSHLRIRLDGEKGSRIYHPTWCITYL